MKTNRLFRFKDYLVHCLLLSAALAPAAVMALPFEIGGKAGFERFKWEEKGQWSERESGYRNTIAAFLHSKPDNERMKFFIYGGEIKLYFSETLDYEDNNPSNANKDYETEYSGLSLDAEAGLRAGSMPFAWDFIGGIGFDSWTRTLDDGMDVRTREVQAEKQTYQVTNMRIGTGPTWRAGRWYARVIAGVKYPVGATVTIDDDDSEYDDNSDDNLDFDIDGNTTGFLTFRNNVRISERFSVKVDLYYDAYKFDRSKTKTTDTDDNQVVDVTIPESKQTNYGIQGGVSIDF